MGNQSGDRSEGVNPQEVGQDDNDNDRSSMEDVRNGGASPTVGKPVRWPSSKVEVLYWLGRRCMAAEHFKRPLLKAEDR